MAGGVTEDKHSTDVESKKSASVCASMRISLNIRVSRAPISGVRIFAMTLEPIHTPPSHAPISVQCLSSMTLQLGDDSELLFRPNVTNTTLGDAIRKGFLNEVSDNGLAVQVATHCHPCVQRPVSALDNETWSTAFTYCFHL